MMVEYDTRKADGKADDIAVLYFFRFSNTNRGHSDTADKCSSTDDGWSAILSG